MGAHEMHQCTVWSSPELPTLGVVVVTGLDMWEEDVLQFVWENCQAFVCQS